MIFPERNELSESISIVADNSQFQVELNFNEITEEERLKVINFALNRNLKFRMEDGVAIFSGIASEALAQQTASDLSTLGS